LAATGTVRVRTASLGIDLIHKALLGFQLSTEFGNQSDFLKIYTTLNHRPSFRYIVNILTARAKIAHFDSLPASACS
jgi:hypothetical protein